MTGEVVVQVVGTFGVHLSGQRLRPSDVGSRKARMLLALLAVDRGRSIHPDHIAKVLWPSGSPGDAAANIATLVSRLRGVLGRMVMVGGRTGYQLGDSVAVDLDEAATLVAEAQGRLAAGEPALALAAAGSALDLLGAGMLASPISGLTGPIGSIRLAGATRSRSLRESTCGHVTVLTNEPDAEWAEPARARHEDLLRSTRSLATEAALGCGDIAIATTLAAAGMNADPFDEGTCRQLMRAYDAGGEPLRALAAYDQLRAILADELGVDPAPATRDLHVAILRGRDTDVRLEQEGGSARPTAKPRAAGEGVLVGRERELARASEAWAAAQNGSGQLLIAGEAGSGKTRLCDELADLARSTGAAVARCRCYGSERSLRLQPVVDLLRQLVGTQPAGVLREAVAGLGSELSALLPEVAPVLGAEGVVPARRSAARGAGQVRTNGRRSRTYEAIGLFLRRLSKARPLLLILDDLQDADAATIELLHFLARQLGQARLLAVGAIRLETGDRVLCALAGVAVRVDLGPLDQESIRRLVVAQRTLRSDGATVDELVAQIWHRTQGNPHLVVETLRSLSAGEAAVSDRLTRLVQDRLGRADARTVEILRAGSVLGTSFTPAAVGRLLGIGPEEAARRCERALRSYLVRASDRSYEFAGELVHEVVYDSIAGPTRAAYERGMEGMRMRTPTPTREIMSAMGGGRPRHGRLPRSCHGRRAQLNRSAVRMPVPSPRGRQITQG